MKKTLWVFFIICLVLSYNASKNNIDIIPKHSNVDVRIKKLKRSFEYKDYKTFFLLFPDSYKELVDFYGFDDRAGKKPLYDYYEAHINYFFKYEDKISSDIFVEKVYEIAKDGAWDADGIGLFQSNLSKLIMNKSHIFSEILSTKPDNDVIGFWHFIFDGSNKYDLQTRELFETIYKRIDIYDKKQSKLLKDEFDKMYE